MRRRRFLVLAGASVAAAACGVRGPALEGAEPSADMREDVDDLDEIAGRIVSGGPPPDGIPPIDSPRYISTAEADAIWRDDEIVDAVAADGRAIAFPRMITVWHEIVNETIAGEPVSITYCPLTGSTVVFSGRLAGDEDTTFGTSGRLYNSNLVMYDRASESWWPQLLGVAVTGERKGERLRELPLAVTTTYGRWKERHPDTVVLSKETGHARAYGTWPYGSYDTTEGLYFPVTHEDDRYPQKKLVIGVRNEGGALAIPKAEFATRRVANIEVGGVPLVALFDPLLETIRVFRRERKGTTLRFGLRDERYVDEQTGSAWSAEGHAEGGDHAGESLSGVSAYQVQWFAWFAFNPETAVLS